MDKFSEHPQPSSAQPQSSRGASLQESQKPISPIASKFFDWEDSSDEEGGGYWPTPVDRKAARVERARQDGSIGKGAGAWEDDLEWDASPACTVGRPGEAARAERARHRMEYATDSQWAILEVESDEIERGAGGLQLEAVLAWRKERGDFKYYSENEEEDDDEEDAYLGDVDVPQLPSDMDDVNEAMLRLCFLKSDLQFECLLRSIAYDAADSKAQLISKLMAYKVAISSRPANTFQILQEQCNASTSNPSLSMIEDDVDEAARRDDAGATHGCSSGRCEEADDDLTIPAVNK